MTHTPARYAAHVAMVAIVVVALSFACVALSSGLWQVFGDAFAAAGVGSLPFYGAWIVIGLVYLAAYPELGHTPWRIQIADRSDVVVATAAAIGALVMYLPAVVRIADTGVHVPDPILLIAGGGIVGPIVEEWLFRGLVWNQLRSTAPGAAGLVTAIVGGALLFGLWHMPFDGVSRTGLGLAGVHAGFGVLLGVMRWRLDGILPGAIVHIVGNTLFVLSA